MFKKEWLNRLVLLLLMFILIFIRFNDFFQYPGRVIEPYGDGFKAYTVIDYHAEYDSSYSHFQGMNYPYGDHAIPSATQPLISNTIKFISDKLVDITDYTIAIVNFSMLLSILLCGWFLYLIFYELGLPAWYNIPITLGLTFLSPQIYRMGAHYGLSHPEVLPALLYMLMRFDKTMKLKYSLWVAVIVFIFSLIHFYYFAILAFSISFYFLFRFLRKFDWKELPLLALHYFFQILLPLIFFVYWLFLQDPISDRTPEPWGFFFFHSYWEGIVASLDQPYFRWVNDHIIKFKPSTLENRSYIGLLALVTSIAMGLHWIKRKGKRPLFVFENAYAPFLHSIFWAAFVILIFSLGIPFTIKGLEFLLDYTGPIRQFRSIGRFAWLFYFVINILAFTWLYEKLKDKNWKFYILIPAILILAMEAFFYNKRRNLKLDTVKEMHSGQSFNDLPGINYDDFQAILTVPYYNIGSDQFWWEPEGYILQKSLTMSIQTGLPVTSAMLTRSSRNQTNKQLQLVSEPYRMPAIFEDLPDNRPFLMMLDQREYEKEKEKYEHLLEGADLIYSEGKRMRIYRQYLINFETRIENRIKKLKRKIDTDTTLVWSNNFAMHDPRLPYYYDRLDGNSEEQKYFGAGGYEGISNGNNIFEIPNLPAQQKEETYTISIWMYYDQDRITRSNFQVDELDENGNILKSSKEGCHRLIKVFDTNGWAMIEMDFTTISASSSFQLTIKNPTLRNHPIFLDELLVRPKDQHVYGKFGEKVWIDNRHF